MTLDVGDVFLDRVSQRRWTSGELSGRLALP